MIIFDVETTGLNPKRHGICSIGAVLWPEGSEFYAEPRVASSIEMDDKALEINGYTREQLTNEVRRPMREILEDFMQWAAQADDLILSGWNGQFDVAFLRSEFERHDLMSAWPFGYRTVDLHSVAYFLMHTIDQFVPKHDGIATIGLNYTLKSFQLPPEPDPHNALTGAKCNVDVWEGFRERLLERVEMPEVPQCPLCEAPMSLRRPNPGQTWREFYGCTRYPECKGSISV